MCGILRVMDVLSVVHVSTIAAVLGVGASDIYALSSFRVLVLSSLSHLYFSDAVYQLHMYM